MRLEDVDAGDKPGHDGKIRVWSVHKRIVILQGSPKLARASGW